MERHPFGSPGILPPVTTQRYRSGATRGSAAFGNSRRPRLSGIRGMSAREIFATVKQQAARNAASR